MGVQVRTLSVNGTGSGYDQTLIQPGVTVLEQGYKLEKHIKIFVFAVNLQIGSAGTVIIKLGDKEVFRDVLNSAGIINVDLLAVSGEPKQPLNISVSNGVTYIGSIVWDFEFSGGDVAQVG